jgi:hypothetical protein
MIDIEYQTKQEFWGEKRKRCQESKDKKIMETYGWEFSKFLLQDEEQQKNYSEDKQ